MDTPIENTENTYYNYHNEDYVNEDYVNDDRKKQIEEEEKEEIEYKKIKSVNNNYEKFPHKCQAEIFNDENGTICNGSIIKWEFVFRYRTSIKNSCDHYQNINLCEYHYNCIISSNGGVKPEPYYEWCVGEAIYELIKDICLEYK